MLTKKTTEAAYAQFLSETNYKRLPKTCLLYTSPSPRDTR